ncbi:uncharacterized protein LOC128244874 [Mya arenaria]|uniref:uncharacterized protein LOC128244874 n=1 Tax=Mya arenaria TaxID=6604 RepID=UPI0022E8E41D|nr:uncharacterized protein LOC128244874 [Mya arenaria]
MDICSILFVLGSLVSMVGGQAECERYSTIALEEVKCRPYVKYFNMVVPWFFGHDEALTNEELLNEVKDKCTNQIQSYRWCVSKLSEQCPLQTAVLHRVTEENVNFYCQGTDAAAWIRQYLSDPFLYEWVCMKQAMSVSTQCAVEVNTPDPLAANWDLETGISALQKNADKLFGCMRRKLAEEHRASSTCTASPTDQLFYFWVHWSFNSVLGFHISPQARQAFDVNDFTRKSTEERLVQFLRSMGKPK